MKIGLALPAFDAETKAPTSMSLLAEYATQAEQLGYDSVYSPRVMPTVGMPPGSEPIPSRSDAT